MEIFGDRLSRGNLIVDTCGVCLPASDGTVVGRRGIISGRMVWALPVGWGGLSRRFSSFAPGESSLFGVDFSFVLPSGSAITFATLAVFTNTFVLAAAPELVVGPVQVDGSVVFARLTGGTEGSDYRLLWTATDTDGNVWPRTALVLCTATS